MDSLFSRAFATQNIKMTLRISLLCDMIIE